MINIRAVLSLVIICIVNLLCSCSSNPVKYYEYYKGSNSEGGGDYCTLEVTKDKVIYRANLTGSYVKSNKKNVRYQYMVIPIERETGLVWFEDFEKLKILIEGISIYYSGPTKIGADTMLEYFQNSSEPSNENWMLNYLSKKEKLQFPLYKKKGNTYSQIGTNRSVKDYKFSIKDLNEIGIWFPPKFKRTRKIDYSLFRISKDLIDKIESGNLKPGEVGPILTFWFNIDFDLDI